MARMCFNKFVDYYIKKKIVLEHRKSFLKFVKLLCANLLLI